MKLLTREAAVAAALGWVGTPYVTGGQVRGAGCDCATLLSAYLIEIGAAPGIPLFTYAQDWFCHTERETYFLELSRYARCVWEGKCVGTPPAQPGDLCLFRVVGSKLYNHGCIVTGWPRAVHAFDKGVCEARPGLLPLTAYQEMAVFSPWG